MNKQTIKVAAIGECMVELSHVENNLYRQRFAGDTFNTSLYLARILGDTGEVYFVSSVGEDPLSEQMVQYWQTESICCDYVSKVSGKLPGLYRVIRDEKGERTFQYWRNDSAAKKLFYCSDALYLQSKLCDFDVLLITGISVAILDADSREKLVVLIQAMRKSGVHIYFDPNYRPILWKSVSHAQKTINQFAMLSDVILPSLDDEKSLYSGSNINDVMQRYTAMGVREIVVKNGEQSCFVKYADVIEEVELSHHVTPLDTTGAGDSFNAGYIAGRIKKLTINESVQMGNQLAATVVLNPGAIIDRDKMPLLIS